MILLIDDNEAERGVTRKILEQAGYSVREAEGGAAGLALYREKKPALVLCDLMMPERSGFDVVRDILALDPEARIIAISGVLFGFGDHETMKEMLHLAGVIEKPYRPARLLQLVRDALG